MGLFNSLFNNESDDKAVLPWIELNNLEQLIELVKKSHLKPVTIFKHSTRCGISSMVLKKFEKSYTIPAESMDMYYLDLLLNREISNAIAINFNVTHQSPQLLILKNGVVVHSSSHSDILNADLFKFI